MQGRPAAGSIRAGGPNRRRRRTGTGADHESRRTSATHHGRWPVHRSRIAEADRSLRRPGPRGHREDGRIPRPCSRQEECARNRLHRNARRHRDSHRHGDSGRRWRTDRGDDHGGPHGPLAQRGLEQQRRLRVQCRPDRSTARNRGRRSGRSLHGRPHRQAALGAGRRDLRVGTGHRGIRRGIAIQSATRR